MSLFGLRRRGAADDDAPPRQWRDALVRVVEGLPDPHAIVDYVLTGRDPAPLAALANVGYTMWLPQPQGFGGTADATALRSLFAGFGAVDPVVLRRWARVLDTVQGSRGWGWALGPLAGHHWHDVMLVQAVAVARATGPLPVTFDDLVRIAALDGVGTRELVVAILGVPAQGYHAHWSGRDRLRRLPGLEGALVDHRDVVAAALTSGSVEARLAALEVVGGALPDDRLDAVVDPLVVAATTSSAQVREAAEAILTRVGDAALTPLRAVALDGSPPERTRALELVRVRPGQGEWARATAAADRAASVRALAAQWEAGEAADVVAPPHDLRLEPLPPTRWAVPRAAAEACARQVVDRLGESIAAENARMAYLHQQGHVTRPRTLTTPTERTYRDLVALLVADAPPSGRVLDCPSWFAGSVLDAMAAEGTLDAASAVKLLSVLDLLGSGPAQHTATRVLDVVHARTGAPDLRALQAMLDGAGVDGRAWVWSSYSRAYGVRLGRDWDDADVWPFVAEQLDWIIATGVRSGWDNDELAVFAAAATLPVQPARLVDHLFAAALGSRKTFRRPAQDALAQHPQVAARAAAGLEDGKSETRLVAAQWLTRLADPSVLPSLQKAWAKERQDVVRGALLDALLAIGESAETYLDPRATSEAAAKFVAKGLPAALAWCDWESLPAVSWASSGDTVPREVVQWLCATSVKARSAEPDAVLRQYAALFDPADRERLAHHLVTAWLHEDVRPVAPTEAEDNARQYATSAHRWLTSDPSTPYHGMTVEQLTAALLPGYLRQPAGSAIASKGLLAVVAACGGRDVVAPVERYLREWFGQRAAQGKALIAMLAWVDHPSATQLVLSIGSRFRTKSFQDEAIAQAQALAERKGWTLDELADRTIPTGGFDDDGTLELSYGPRTFVARLRPDLTLDLRDADGKALKTLPPPRQSDDADQAKEARKTLTAAKKDVKTVADLQQRRLYEALCTERSWSADDWQRYLCAHPVVGPAVRRLVWVATADDGSDPVVFRPLDDGSLTDVDDAPVTLAATARVRLAHDSVLTAEQVEAWTAHLADYEVVPLFEQLGRGLHAVTADDRSRRTLEDFEGHVLEAFALRSRAARLGYTRGPSGDGGWFHTYVKRFPTLGLTAEIEFTGNTFPEENRVVALRTLSFHRERPAGEVREELTLGDVPAVLASECWHDMRQMAAQGGGYDPAWEKKTEL